ncbi:MAG: radical SAM protein [Anaerolineae bacterium]|nr:radical SAM protein [Anaerolineae bacterium]
MPTPGYVRLLRSGELTRRVRLAHERLKACRLCPRACGSDRLAGELGACRTGALPLVSSYGPHFGEEAPLVGHGGSGTIFFAGCNLSCIYCQNYPLSHGLEGDETEIEELAAMMLRLQQFGCHNVNLVSPSHVVPQILAAIALAAQTGLRLPIVYNTGGYDLPETLRLLDGVVDIYMPDAKYADSNVGRSLSGVRRYPAVNRAMIREANRQVGPLTADKRGVATRGLLVRHLVLPHGLSGTEQVMQFLGDEVSRHTYVNVMQQYRPCYRAAENPLLARRITSGEYRQALEAARAAGLYRLDGLWQFQ